MFNKLNTFGFKKISIIIISILFLFSCGNDTKKIEEAKKDILGNQEKNIEKTVNAEDLVVENIEEKIKKDKIKIEYMTEDKFIVLDDIDEDKITSGEIEITGTAIYNSVEKIVVDFSNSKSDFKNDTYELQKFKLGDKDFKYIASSRFQVLDFGENIYMFKAYIDDKISIVKVTINIENTEDEQEKNEIKENKKEDITYEEKLIGTEDDTVFLNLPIGTDFGKPILLGEDSFTYSKVDGLEISKEVIDSITCEGLTDFLRENINSWFYWNTCRNIVKDKTIGFYVVKLVGDNYVYEKHYVDYIHGFYGVLELKKGSDVTKDNIKEKNDELKKINDTFNNVNIVDKLFKEIVK